MFYYCRKYRMHMSFLIHNRMWYVPSKCRVDCIIRLKFIIYTHNVSDGPQGQFSTTCFDGALHSVCCITLLTVRLEL